MGEASEAQREYSRNIAAYTLKQLIQWRASLERLSKERERESVQDSVDQHDSNGYRARSTSPADCCECIE